MRESKLIFWFLMKSFFVCAGAIFIAMVLGVYVSGVIRGVDVDFYEIVRDAAINSIRGSLVMTAAAGILMLKNYLSRKRK